MKQKTILNKNTIFPGLGGFQYGYNCTVIAAALPLITAQFALQPAEQGLLAGALILGAFFTSCFSGILANRLGRKFSMILSAWAFVLGISLSCFATHFWGLIAARFVVGFASGIITTTAPLYLAEIAPPEKRGKVVNLNQIGISLGSLTGYLSGYIFSSNLGWKGMFALGLIPALIQGIGLCWTAETYSSSNTSSLKTTSWKTLFSSEYRARVFFAMALCAIQQLSGVNAVFYYSPYILQSSGYSIASALLCTVGMGIMYVFAIVLSLTFVDKIGRRPLVLASLAGLVVHMAILSLFFESMSPYSLLFITLFYALGIGPIPQLIIAEMCPVSIRAHTLTLAGFVGWICNFSVTFTFLELGKLISIQTIFLLYALIGLAGFFFLLKKTPETKESREFS